MSYPTRGTMLPMASAEDIRRKEAARNELVAAVVKLGFPPEFGSVIAEQLGGEKSMRHMTSYLRGAKPRSMEEVADELLAILEQRSSWVEHKISERANASITAFYNRPRD